MANLVSRLCGKIDPLSIKDYKTHDGFIAFQQVLFQMTPQEVIDIIRASNLRGRGGAAFPTGLKWSFVARAPQKDKYVICNADEGEPGTFKDRVLIEGCPYQLIEGMMIAGYAVGANKGYIYIRGEYPRSQEKLKSAIRILRKRGYLGEKILGQDFDFDIEIRSGAGAYVCGEETALIESIEGKPGRSRFKPPYPPNNGLWEQPTLVNNVETLCNIPPILQIGADQYNRYGTKESSGTKLLSVSGCVMNPGVYEIEFGTTIRTVIYDLCGGMKKGKQLKFIQLGGSSGACLPPQLLDTPLDFEALKQLNIGLGSGALLVVDREICIVDFVKATMAFFEHESCGKCTPCREGNRHIIKILDSIIKGEGTEQDMRLLKQIAKVMEDASLCGLGQAATTALTTTIKYFEKEYLEHLKGYCRTGQCTFNREVM